MKIFELAKIKADEMGAAIKKYLANTLPNYDTLYGNNTIFGQIVNVTMSIAQNIMLYIEDALTEQNKLTAQRKKSIYGLAIQSGYIPSLGKAASCSIRLTPIPNNIDCTSVIITDHTRIVCSQNGLVYNIVLPQESIHINLTQDASSQFLQAIEGNYETQEYVSHGGRLYTQHVSFTGDLDMDYITVKINDKIWERVESLYDMRADGLQYYVVSSVTGGLDIMFGNGTYGRALAENDQISVTYLIHDGELGNISCDNKVYFSFADKIASLDGDEIDGNEIFTISLADKNEVGGGTYSESSQQVKAMIGFNSRSLVLADADNYRNILNKFSFVGYNKTWSEKGSMVVNSIVLRNYKMMLRDGADYFTLTPSQFFLTDDQKSSIMTCIASSGSQLAGMTYEIHDPILRKYALYVYLHMKDVSYNKDAVKAKVRDVIGNFMATEANDWFIPKSDIIQLIKNNVDAVDGVDAYFLSERNETAIIKGRYTDRKRTYNITTGTYDITSRDIMVEPGTDPGLGLDSHGNISLDSDDEYPVIMGGWSFISSETINEVQQTTITDPLIIIFD